MDINDKLLDLYSSEIKKLKSADIKAENIDGPLLMHCWEEEYFNSKYKPWQRVCLIGIEKEVTEEEPEI